MGIAQRKRTNSSPGVRRLVGQHGRANGAHDCGVRPLRGRGAQRPGGMGGRRSRPGGIEKGGFPPLRRPLFSARPIFAFAAYFFSTPVMYFGYKRLNLVRRGLAASKNGAKPLLRQGKRESCRPSSVNTSPLKSQYFAPQESKKRPSSVNSRAPQESIANRGCQQGYPQKLWINPLGRPLDAPGNGRKQAAPLISQ